MNFETLVNLVAGGIGGTAGAVVTCPLEVVKTRLQSSTTFNGSPNVPPSNGAAKPPSRPGGPTSSDSGPSTSRMTSYGRRPDPQPKKFSLVYTSSLKDDTKSICSTKTSTVSDLRGQKRFTSNFSALVNCFRGRKFGFLNNKNIFSTNSAGNDFRHMSLLRHLKHIVKNEGFWSLWRGLGPTLIGVAPSRAIYFCAYSNAKSRLNQVFVPETPAVHVCSATFAGFWSATMTNPVWLIRTRLQLDRSTGDRKLTVTKCIRTVFKEKGLVGFYRGVTASYVGISETVIHFVIYEYLKSSITANSNGERKASHFLQYMLCAGISSMPLKLTSFTLKKRGGYNLNDCNFYILAVQMLDGSILQCTLKIASTGEDCMQYIMQKLELQRNLYFGLKYKCSPTVYRWIDFRKALKKQLVKHAYEFKLYFSVMFYVSDPEFLSNPTERYCYYLQLKSDIITGRLFGPPEKSILCASYSLQAEFGDYDPLKQNEESLRNFTLLPLHMTKSAQILEGIVKQALHGHQQLKGMSQAEAELAYIKEAKNFDGYGEEYFTGHDEEKAEVFLGYCLSGIVVKRIQSSPVIYGWKEIKKITCNNRRLYLVCFEISHRIVFHLEDATTAEYVSFLFGLQLEFNRRLSSNGKTDSSKQNSTLVSLNDSNRSKTSSFSGKIDSGFEDFNNSFDARSKNPHEHQSPICSGFSDMKLNSNFGSKFSVTNSSNSCIHLHNDGHKILPPYRPVPDYDSLFKHGVSAAEIIRPLSNISTSMPYLNLCLSDKQKVGQSLSLEASAEHVLVESLPFEALDDSKILSTCLTTYSDEFSNIPKIEREKPLPSCLRMNSPTDCVEYILGITPINIFQFEQMLNIVWIQDCRIIVALNEQINYMSKSFWSKIANFHLDLRTSVGQKRGRFVTSVLHLSDAIDQDQRRTIYHVQCTCGQNFDKDAESFVELLEEINSLQLLVKGDMEMLDKKPKNDYSSVFVHCANGFDWSGVFALTHYALKLYHHHERCNLANILSTMRQSMQMNLVPYVEQYSFCHACLSIYAKKSRLI